MFIIRIINSRRYWQMVERLPKKLENAVTFRYERSRFAVRTLLIVATAIVLGLWVWTSVLSFDGQVAVWWACLVVFATGTFATFAHFGLMDRHRKMMSDLEMGWSYHYGLTPSSYLMPDNDPIFIAIMTPELSLYLMNVGQGGMYHTLSTRAVFHFEEYYIEAKVLLDERNKAIRDTQSETEKITLDYMAKQALNALAEEYVELITVDLRDAHLHPGNFFTTHSEDAHARYTNRLTVFITESKKEIERLNHEIEVAQVPME